MHYKHKTSQRQRIHTPHSIIGNGGKNDTERSTPTGSNRKVEPKGSRIGRRWTYRKYLWILDENPLIAIRRSAKGYEVMVLESEGDWHGSVVGKFKKLRRAKTEAEIALGVQWELNGKTKGSD